MRKTKKLLSLLLILWTLWASYVSADDESKKVAENYIKEMENFWPFWKWKKPKIVKETPFYTYDDKNISYIEYKVSCRDDKDCGYVLVNIDKSDVKVPISSTTGKSLSEQMDEKNTWKNKNYYFDVFNQFAITNTWKINTTSPENKFLDNGENIYTRNVDKNPLYERFKEIQKISNENKEENIKRQENLIYTTRSVKPIYNNDTWVVNNKFFDEKKCKSLTPCYSQYDRVYDRWANWPIPETVWPTWCWPTSMSILFWFYDKYWYSDIIFWEPSSLWNHRIRWLQIDIWDLMNTILEDWNWWTFPKEIVKWFKYLDKKYKHNWWFRISYNDNTFWEYIKEEIKAWRPLLLSYYWKKSWHIVVVQWYSWNKLLINFWWGADRNPNTLVDLNWNSFYFENDIKRVNDIYIFKFL